ncbi:hypothetical protein HME9302_01660 [Alteripontixanthobacter maritimus]|uniref:Uncharacterized protein n=1 Tax=Alteripontixanthobacter maritimus TaxID=2161824 RepID=A0A369Q6E7_9SPHN|nr:hypothetical protein HME9302_01660 [Alteripontixanthobacter maritimus]
MVRRSGVLMGKVRTTMRKEGEGMKKERRTPINLYFPAAQLR